MVQKLKNSDASNSDTPKGNCTVHVRMRKSIVCVEFGTIRGPGHPLESWNVALLDKGELPRLRTLMLSE